MPASVYVPSHLETRSTEDETIKHAGSVFKSHNLSISQEEAGEDDSSLRTVDGLMRRRARLHPNTHAVSYPSSGIAFVDYTMQDLDVFAWRVAKHYEKDLPSRASSQEKPAVVALLGPSNLEYLITVLALTKLGHTVLFLSTRIPQPAIESLLTMTGATTLMVDQRYAELASRVQGSMSLELLEIAGRPVFDYAVEIRGDTRLDSRLDPEIEKSNIAFIIHSSGSTGLPKPIFQTQLSCLHNYATSMNMKALITLPIYHNFGLSNLFRAIYASKSIHLYNADLPLTQDYLVKIMRATQFEIFYGVPYALKLLSEVEEGIDLLRQMKIVMYGGSACPDDLGNTLVENGVNLIGHYGATEVGQLMTSFRSEGDKAWNYVREHERLAPFLRWAPRGPNLYECTIADGWPAKVQSNLPDGSYATKDLFEPHPTIPRAWKYIARLDDTIVLVNGEKFGPVGMEGQIRSSKNITEAVVFGSGRPYLGVLVVPASSLADKSHEDVLEAVWSVVEAANEAVDAFARISKGMICLLPADCPYPRTDKGSIIRQAFYRTFEKEIAETYNAQDAGAGADLQSFDLPGLCQFVRKTLAETLATPVEVEDDTDLFLLGLDSLQALQIRSQILRNVNLGEGVKLGQNVVFEYPSIEKLSRYLYALSTGEDTVKSASIENEMQDLINKYSNVQETTLPSVVVTGATGSLGAHVLAQLSSNPEITTIYCLVRASDADTALKRVKESLLQRKIYHELPLLSCRKIVALPSDLSQPKLGLTDGAYEQVAQSLRAVIHCAWPVNFNMQLSSFEKGNIAGVNHLLALCKSSPRGSASMNFCSSVSTCTRSTTIPIPETIPNFEWAQDMGYAQSKSVAEHLCAKAAQQGTTTRVLRVGQIVGDTQHGVWNAQEAVPMMMQTAVTIGALPTLQETPSWLPVDTVAAAVADISLSEASSLFANVTHPKTFNFVDDLLPALRSAGLEFEEVEPKEWIRRLRASNSDPKVNPPIKLVDFFASKYDKDSFSPSKGFATEVACSLSPALANAPVIDTAFVKKFIDYFLQQSWSQPANEESKTAIFMAGPSGTGKSTIGSAAANWLKTPFIEGDCLHTKRAVDKMRSHEALSDDDRWDWLNRLAAHATEAVEDLSYPSVVVSCSALKRSYRSQLRQTLSAKGIRAVFVDLQVEGDVLVERLSARKDHYMSKEMVKSQVAAYEGAESDETDVLPVDASVPVEGVVEEVKWLLKNSGIAP